MPDAERGDLRVWDLPGRAFCRVERVAGVGPVESEPERGLGGFGEP